MTTTVISIQEFEAEREIKIMGGKSRWEACQVVGAIYNGPHENGAFLVMRENEDGSLFIDGAEIVRRV